MDKSTLLRLGKDFDLLHGLVDAHVFHHMATILHDGEMSFSQLNTIYRLYRHGPHTISEIAQGADISHNAASRMVERLVRAGIVERNEVSTDRRQKRVALTTKGVERLQDLKSFTVNRYADMFAQLPEELVLRLEAVLGEVKQHLPTHPLSDLPEPNLGL